MSLRKPVYLADSEREEHTVVFRNGEMVEILCPLATEANEPDWTDRPTAAKKGKRTKKSQALSGSADPAIAAARPDLKLVGGAPKPKYTSKQGQYLAFIHLYTKLHRCPPAEADLQRYFGTTPPAIHQMIVGLEMKGLIHRRPYEARSIRITIPPEELPDLE